MPLINTKLKSLRALFKPKKKQSFHQDIQVSVRESRIYATRNAHTGSLQHLHSPLAHDWNQIVANEATPVIPSTSAATASTLVHSQGTSDITRRMSCFYDQLTDFEATLDETLAKTDLIGESTAVMDGMQMHTGPRNQNELMGLKSQVRDLQEKLARMVVQGSFECPSPRSMSRGSPVSATPGHGRVFGKRPSRPQLGMTKARGQGSDSVQSLNASSSSPQLPELESSAFNIQLGDTSLGSDASEIINDDKEDIETPTASLSNLFFYEM